MNETCETVKITDQNGDYIIINKSDLQAEHVLFDVENKTSKTRKQRQVADDNELD